MKVFALARGQKGTYLFLRSSHSKNNLTAQIILSQGPLLNVPLFSAFKEIILCIIYVIDIDGQGLFR